MIIAEIVYVHKYSVCALHMYKMYASMSALFLWNRHVEKSSLPLSAINFFLCICLQKVGFKFIIAFVNLSVQWLLLVTSFKSQYSCQSKGAWGISSLETSPIFCE